MQARSSLHSIKQATRFQIGQLLMAKVLLFSGQKAKFTLNTYVSVPWVQFPRILSIIRIQENFAGLLLSAIVKNDGLISFEWLKFPSRLVTFPGFYNFFLPVFQCNLAMKCNLVVVTFPSRSVTFPGLSFVLRIWFISRSLVIHDILALTHVEVEECQKQYACCLYSRSVYHSRRLQAGTRAADEGFKPETAVQMSSPQNSVLSCSSCL